MTLARALPALLVLLAACSDVSIQRTPVPRIRIDTFRQPASESLDVLWLIDRSCSMDEADDERALDAIARALDTMPEGVSWRMGVTSTDPEATLLDSQFPLVPGDDEADALALLDAVDRGHAREQGLAAMRAHVDEHPDRGTPDDWMRPDAALLAVVVSDEDDQSPGSVAAWASWFRSVRPDSYLVAVTLQASPICGEGAGQSVGLVGDRYREAVEATSGELVEFCSRDWADTAAESVAGALRPVERFPLSGLPVESSITVDADGEPYSGAWVYDPSDNAIEFGDVPGPGVFVAVGYALR